MTAAAGGSSLRRGLLALAALAEADLGVVEVARRLGVDKSQASRTLRALADHGLAERDAATRAYRLGPRLFAYAALVSERRLLQATPAVLAELVAAVGERAHLSVLDGVSVLTLVSQSPPHAVQTAGWAGRTVPAHCTAAGRALLADHDMAALRARFGAGALERHGPGAPATIAELATRIAAARARGYDVAEEELEPGLAAVAAPVRRFDGEIVAAINVSGPCFRFAPHLESAGAEVLRAAARLAAELTSSTRVAAEAT